MIKEEPHPKESMEGKSPPRSIDTIQENPEGAKLTLTFHLDIIRKIIQI